MSTPPSAGLVLTPSGLQCSRPKKKSERILDLPSGHGRVLRYLKAEYPDARLTACDIHPDAVDFCAQVLGATPIYGQAHPNEMEFQDKFDLIWCGSLLTHLDVPMWHEFLGLFESLLEVGGLLIFTTHGRSIAPMLRDVETAPTSRPMTRRREAILRAMKKPDLGTPTTTSRMSTGRRGRCRVNFGQPLPSRHAVCRLIESRPRLRVSYMENRCGIAQDVVALRECRKRSEREAG